MVAKGWTIYAQPQYEERLKRLALLRLKGTPLSKCAEELGISRRTVARYWRFIKDNPELFFPQQAIEWYRSALWQKLFQLIDDPKVKEHQALRAIVDVLRSVEPINARIIQKQEGKIEVTWGDGIGEANRKRES